MFNDVTPRMAKAMTQEMTFNISRPIVILRGYKNIAAGIRVSRDKIRDYELAGAPIYSDKGVPKADMTELWLWYVERMRAMLRDKYDEEEKEMKKKRKLKP